MGLLSPHFFIIRDFYLFYNLPSLLICQDLHLYFFYAMIHVKKDKPGMCVSFRSV